MEANDEIIDIPSEDIPLTTIDNRQIEDEEGEPPFKNLKGKR